MTRVSLKEAYDNKDVVAQIFAIKDTANGAEETANNASTTANEAKTHVDTVAVDVERAVVTANNASESAQESARVVAGYDARLTTAEDGVARNRSDIQTIDGEITDIYNDLTNVVRKVGDAGQVIQNGLTLRGTNRVSNTTVGELNDIIVNAKRLIEEIDTKLNAYAFMVRTVGDQDIGSVKNFTYVLKSSGTLDFNFMTTANDPDGKWLKIGRWKNPNLTNQAVVIAIGSAKPTLSRRFGIALIGGNFPNNPVCVGMGSSDLSGLVAVACDAEGYAYLMVKRGGNYGFIINVLMSCNWGGLAINFESLAVHDAYDDLTEFVSSAVIA